MVDNSILKICEVVSVYDATDGGRIKARVLPEDSKFGLDEIPYAFPLLPKLLHVTPKVGEAVLIIKMDINNGYNQRFYIGPIISQPQFKSNDPFNVGGQTMLNGSLNAPSIAPSTNPDTNGAYPSYNDTALIGRGNTDIILRDNDIQIRSGVHLSSNTDNTKAVFNPKNPSFIQCKTQIGDDDMDSAIINVADKIVLLGNQSKIPFKTVANDLISNNELEKIIANTFSIPYGEKIVQLLESFIKAFQTHTHPYSGLPPCQDDTYNTVSNYDLNSILSDSVKIN